MSSPDGLWVKKLVLKEHIQKNCETMDKCQNFEHVSAFLGIKLNLWVIQSKKVVNSKY